MWAPEGSRAAWLRFAARGSRSGLPWAFSVSTRDAGFLGFFRVLGLGLCVLGLGLRVLGLGFWELDSRWGFWSEKGYGGF